MSTYLQMVAALYRELKLSGTAPTTVVAQTSQKRDICECVADAAYEIETLWADWDFMWKEHSVATVIGTAGYAKPTDYARYDLKSFVLDYTLSTYRELDYIKYKEWRDAYRNGVKTNAYPDKFTIKPDKTIVLEGPPDAVYTLTCDYWKAPTKMTADASLSNIPVHYEPVIAALAKMKFGERFSDNGAFMSGKGKYDELIKRMEANELPNRQGNLSEAEDIIMVVE